MALWANTPSSGWLRADLQGTWEKKQESMNHSWNVSLHVSFCRMQLFLCTCLINFYSCFLWYLLSLSLLGISAHFSLSMTALAVGNPWIECGCPQKQSELETTAWRFSLMKITCSAAQLCPTPVSGAKAHAQGRGRDVSALGLAVLALAAGRQKTVPWAPCPAGQPGEGRENIWGRTEMLRKPLRQQGVLGKTRWTEPTSTKWPQRRRAESVMWQLKKGQWQFLWSSLFLLSTGINLRQRFRLGRKKSVLSKKKKTVDLPLPSGERLYLRALDICWFSGVFLIPLPMRKGLWVFWGSKLLKLLPEDLIYSCKVRAAHGSPVPYSLGHEGGERKSSCCKHQCCFYPLLYLLLLHRSLTH